MKYDKQARQAINRLSAEKVALFYKLESFEQGELLAVPELCQALSNEPQLVVFSCLSGDGITQEIGQDLGVMFKERRMKVTSQLLTVLRQSGYAGSFLVILDDCEPSRVWQWQVSAQEVTDWCEMLVEEAGANVPEGWCIKLWSELELNSGLNYEDILFEMRKPDHALLLHQQLEHMKKHPNKKLVGNIKEACLRRLAEYALQGVVLEKQVPQAVLIQTETPWNVKDSLYGPLRTKSLPIIHPYPEERR